MLSANEERQHKREDERQERVPEGTEGDDRDRNSSSEDSYRKFMTPKRRKRKDVDVVKQSLEIRDKIRNEVRQNLDKQAQELHSSFHRERESLEKQLQDEQQQRRDRELEISAAERHLFDKFNASKLKTEPTRAMTNENTGENGLRTTIAAGIAQIETKCRRELETKDNRMGELRDAMNVLQSRLVSMSEDAHEKQAKTDGLQSQIHTERENFLEQKERLIKKHDEQCQELRDTLDRERNIFHAATARSKSELHKMESRITEWDVKHAASKHLTKQQVADLHEAHRKQSAHNQELKETVSKLEAQIAKFRDNRDAVTFKATVQEKRADAVINGMDALRNKVHRLELENDNLSRAKRGLVEENQKYKQRCERMNRCVERHEITVAETREKQNRMKEQLDFAQNEVESIRTKANDSKKRLSEVDEVFKTFNQDSK